MRPIAKILVLLCATISQAIELPGNCPSVPPTHSPNYITFAYHREIVHGVPFTIEHPSNLFKAFDSINVVGFFTIALQRDQYVFNITYLNSTYFFDGSLSTYDTAKDQALWLTSDIRKGHQLCHGPITEEIRIWDCEDLLIIWSCIANETVNSHDEAVLFLSKAMQAQDKDAEFYKTSADYRKIMQKINSTARKYLGDSLLLDTIDWDQDIADKTANYVAFECPLSPLEGRNIKGDIALFIVSLFLLSFFLLMAFGFFCDVGE